MSNTVFKARVYVDGLFVHKDITSPRIVRYSDPSYPAPDNNIFVFPGFVDVHVHLREPGFSYKETVLTGTASARCSGYSAVCTMPNLDPVPDSLENLNVQLDIIKRDARVRTIPFGALTVGEKGEKIADLEAMAPYVAGVSDDGHGVQSKELMKEAMTRAKALGKIVSAHCEVNSLLNGGCIHDGEYARRHGHRGISSESEWRMIERDIDLAIQTGCAYHVCHISTKESVELIRQAKQSGVDVTCETAPHYLVLTDNDIKEDGRFKMNPPLRSEDDRDALIMGVYDGTVDMIATDHAPHSTEEKSWGLEKSLMGVVGLETAFPILYTKLVDTKIIPLRRLIELMSTNPSRRFNIPVKEFFAFDLEEEYIIIPDAFLTMGRSTPFDGEKVKGRCIGEVKNFNEII